MPPKTELPKKSNPSLAYEVLIYLNSFYFGMFACCELGMGVLKAINLAYSTQYLLIRDSCVLVTLLVIESIRCVMGRRGRLINKDWPVVTSIFLTIPCFLGVTYLVAFQTYKLRLEYCLCTLMLMLYLTELWYALMFLFSLCRPVTYD